MGQEILQIKNPRISNKEQAITNVIVKRMGVILGKGQKPTPTMCIEFTVIGNKNTWRDFLTAKEFAGSNPTLVGKFPELITDLINN